MAEVINFSNLPKWRRRLRYCSRAQKVRVIFRAANEWLWERWVRILPSQRDAWTTLIVEAADEVLYPECYEPTSWTEVWRRKPLTPQEIAELEARKIRLE